MTPKCLFSKKELIKEIVYSGSVHGPVMAFGGLRVGTIEKFKPERPNVPYVLFLDMDDSKELI